MAIYVHDLENMKNFFVHFFSAQANQMYHNPKTGLRTYFLTFADGSRLVFRSVEQPKTTRNTQA